MEESPRETTSEEIVKKPRLEGDDYISVLVLIYGCYCREDVWKELKASFRTPKEYRWYYPAVTDRVMHKFIGYDFFRTINPFDLEMDLIKEKFSVCTAVKPKTPQSELLTCLDRTGFVDKSLAELILKHYVPSTPKVSKKLEEKFAKEYPGLKPEVYALLYPVLKEKCKDVLQTSGFRDFWLPSTTELVPDNFYGRIVYGYWLVNLGPKDSELFRLFDELFPQISDRLERKLRVYFDPELAEDELITLNGPRSIFFSDHCGRDHRVDVGANRSIKPENTDRYFFLGVEVTKEITFYHEYGALDFKRNAKTIMREMIPRETEFVRGVFLPPREILEKKLLQTIVGLVSEVSLKRATEQGILSTDVGFALLKNGCWCHQ